MNIVRGFLQVAALFCIPIAAIAADARQAVPSSATLLDNDFFFQGEYSGSLCAAENKPLAVGLQVMALGDGDFSAVEFSGGLPGNGWDRSYRRTYTGRARDSNVVELSGNGRRIVLRRGWAFVSEDGGRTLGRLQKLLRRSQTLSAPAPAGAQVLFAGRDTGEFAKSRISTDHLLAVGTVTRQPVDNFVLHLEFRTPYMPKARGQGRGNSGVYIQGRYEVQILDSFGLEGVNNECGGLYRQRAPLVNMCLPPLAWQTYDIDFRAARFDDSGSKTDNARITVLHNGVVIHDGVEITAKTGGGAAEGPDAQPIKLQDHGNPVFFRNIWIAERKHFPRDGQARSLWESCLSEPILGQMPEHAVARAWNMAGDNGWRGPSVRVPKITRSRTIVEPVFASTEPSVQRWPR